ncbi:glycosyltransferase family 4 protein [Omnitrophica bacterium]|nr:glycosyltransferase family 4 protein [Candidatus Omnitrophota bacterium]
MKILFINQTFYPDVASTAQHLWDLTLSLNEKGHRIAVLSGRRCYVSPNTVYPAKEMHQGITIYRTWPPLMKRLHEKARVLEALLVNLAFAWKLLWIGKYDKVVAMTSPPMVPFVSCLFAKFHRSDFINWVMDVNPDEIIEAGWIKETDIRARILDSVLRYALGTSHTVVVLDRFMKQRIMDKGVSGPKIEICPPWPHDEDLEMIPHVQNPFRTNHRIQDKFVIMYSGNHSLCHPLDTLLEAARRLRDDAKFVFLFIGGGERVREVTAFKERHGLSNIIQMGYQARSAIKYSLSAADLHTVVMGDRFVGVVHPCKIYGILKIGRPFLYIGPKESHIGDLMARAKMGFQVDHGNAAEASRVIKTVQQMSSQEKKDLSAVSQNMIHRNFSGEVLINRLSQLIVKS